MLVNKLICYVQCRNNSSRKCWNQNPLTEFCLVKSIVSKKCSLPPSPGWCREWSYFADNNWTFIRQTAGENCTEIIRRERLQTLQMLPHSLWY